MLAEEATAAMVVVAGGGSAARRLVRVDVGKRASAAHRSTRTHYRTGRREGGTPADERKDFPLKNPSTCEFSRGTVGSARRLERGGGEGGKFSLLTVLTFLQKGPALPRMAIQLTCAVRIPS